MVKRGLSAACAVTLDTSAPTTAATSITLFRIFMLFGGVVFGFGANLDLRPCAESLAAPKLVVLVDKASQPRLGVFNVVSHTLQQLFPIGLLYRFENFFMFRGGFL